MKYRKWEHYIEQYGKDIYSFCMFLTKSRQEADDLYQDTFLRAIEKNEVNEDDNPKAYLIGIAINVWNNKKRKFLWRRKKVDVVYCADEMELDCISDGTNQVEMQMVRKQIIMDVRKAVSELPEKMKIVVLMYYMEELTVEEISKTLLIPTGTVKSRLHSARMLLKGVMEEANYE